MKNSQIGLIFLVFGALELLNITMLFAPSGAFAPSISLSNITLIYNLSDPDFFIGLGAIILWFFRYRKGAKSE
jgi:hypothetical protein